MSERPPGGPKAKQPLLKMGATPEEIKKLVEDGTCKRKDVQRRRGQLARMFDRVLANYDVALDELPETPAKTSLTPVDHNAAVVQERRVSGDVESTTNASLELIKFKELMRTGKTLLSNGEHVSFSIFARN